MTTPAWRKLVLHEGDLDDSGHDTTGGGAVTSVDGLTGAVDLSGNYDALGAAAAAQSAAIAASQSLDSDLTAIAALTTTSYGRAFLALADAAAARTALALGTAATHATGDYDAAGAAAAAQAASQPLDSDLTAIAALTTTSYGRAFLALADAAAGRTALGLGTAAVAATGDFDAAGAAAAAQAASQPLDSDLTAFAGLAIAADKLPYGTGSHTLGLADLTAAGRALIDDADAAAQRTTLGLGTLATQSGTFSGTSSGTNTGDQTLPTRASLGLATSDTPQLAGIEVGHATDTTLARSGAGDLSVEGKGIYRADGTDVPVADGGTGASTAAAGLANLGGQQRPLYAARQSATATGTGDQNLFTLAIAGGTLGTTTGLRIIIKCRRTTGAGNVTLKPKYGATLISNFGGLSGPDFYLETLLWADGATGAQRWDSRAFAGSGTLSRTAGTAAKDSTASQDLTFDIALATTSDVVTLDWVSVERLAP